MAFRLGDYVIDRIQYATAENTSGDILYVLTQLTDASIDISAESQDATDAQGTLVKRFWKGKSGEFTATNAMLNMNIVASGSGSDVAYATSVAPIAMPRIMAVKSTDSVTLTGLVSGSAKVYELTNDGQLGKKYTLDTTASADNFAISAAGALTLPTDSSVTRFLVKYEKNVQDGAHIANSADKFPATVKLTLKALAITPCEPDVLKGIYIVLPSFQPSPETSLALSTESTLDYTGALQVGYCTGDKELYSVYLCDEEDDD